MSAYIEALILYTILFLSGSAGPAAENAGFSTSRELARVFWYNIPSLALIWHLLLKERPLKEWGISLPNRKDLLPALAALSALILTGFIIAGITPFFSDIPRPPAIIPPAGVPAWIILACSCVSAGYLEESFFRFYILSKRRELRLTNSQAALVSALSFSLCHLYEGPWGFLNATLSGIMLSFVFLRYRSLHGVALAHGLYNIFAYVLAGF